MSLRSRIITLVAIPFLGLAGLAFLELKSGLEDLTTARQVEGTLQSTLIVADLIHAMQIERGMSAGSIGSGGTTFAEALPAHRKDVDALVAQLGEVGDTFSVGRADALAGLQTEVARLGEWRARIDGLRVGVPEMAAFYTGAIRLGLALNDGFFAQIPIGELAVAGNARVALNEGKEAAGLERATGAAGFGSGDFSADLRRRFATLNDVQTTELRNAERMGRGIFPGLNLLDQPQRAALSRFRTPVLSGAPTAAIKATDWFAASTEWIDQLRAMDIALSEHMWALAATKSTAARRWVWVGTAMSAIATLFVVLAVLVANGTASALTRVGSSVKGLTRRAYAKDIPDTDRNDEIGAIAKDLEALRADLETHQAVTRDSIFRGAALETSDAAVMMVDSEMKISWINKSLHEALQRHQSSFAMASAGFDPDKVVGQPIDFFHEPDVNSRLRALLRDPANFPYRTQIVVGEARFNLTLNCVIGDDGQPQGHVVEWLDVTEFFLNKAILDSIEANQVKATFEISGKLVRTNKHFCDMMAMEEGCLLGSRSDAVFKFDETMAEERGSVFSRLNKGETVYGRFRLPRRDGSIAIVDGGFTPVMDARGKALRTVLIGTDVTEIQQAIETAEAKRAEMEAAQFEVVEALRKGLGGLSAGDLTSRIDTVFATDYEQLRLDFNQAGDQLLAAMNGVVDNADQIRSNATEISSAADDLSARTEKQAATLEQTAAALDELTASVTAAAEGAAHADEIVESAKDDAESSGKVVAEAVAAMQEIEASSQKISKITDVIDEISFQTNLLALNAGVEAARAGEAGRGFAVVASEVRALAQRSSDAAGEINELISTSDGHVKRGAGLVRRTGEALTGIVAGVKRISEHVGEISASSREQSTGLSEINSAVNQLDQVTQQNAAMFEQTTAASHNLTRQAETLNETVGRFKTGTPAPGPANTLVKGDFPTFSARKDQAPPAARTGTAAAAAEGFAQSPERDRSEDWAEF